MRWHPAFRRHPLSPHAIRALAPPGIKRGAAWAPTPGPAPALARYGKPEIFNTDQGSQFTSLEFTGALKDAGFRISMVGRGRCMDNIFIERLWRSLKYEAVYLHELTDGFKAERVIGEWIDFYNTERPHSAAIELSACLATMPAMRDPSNWI